MSPEKHSWTQVAIHTETDDQLIALKDELDVTSKDKVIQTLISSYRKTYLRGKLV